MEKWKKMWRSYLPPQEENLLERIRKCIESGEYRFSAHATKRRAERLISYQDALYVLTNGVHESNKTSFDLRRGCWKYAIRGKTMDNVEVRVVVGFEEGMIVITVIRLSKKK